MFSRSLFNYYNANSFALLYPFAICLVYKYGIAAP